VVRRAMVGAAALTVVVGVLAGCGRDHAPPASPAPGSSTVAGGLGSSSSAAVGSTACVIAVTVRGGQVSGETGRVTVPLGCPVTLSVTSDVADEIHLHGYDRKAETPAGGTASISFTATIPGVFEAELEQSKLQLVQLQVG
jgi:hypothetical protein